MKNLFSLLRVIVVCAAVVFGLPAPTLAADLDTIASVENYLNGMPSLKARFTQVSANGDTVEGTLYLSRPGHMRLEYDPPSPILIVADGTFLIYFDIKLQQTSYVGLDSTPAGILLRDHIKLGGDVTVTGIRHLPGAIEIGLIQTDDASAGELTLILSQKPLALRQWRVKDAEGQVVTVSLFDIHVGTILNPELFKFHDPSFFKQKQE